jgi:NADH dehydrogenase FAD-containing subunit
VLEVRADRVVLGNGASLPATLVLWATSARAPEVIAMSRLPHDQRGRLLVDGGLRATDGSPVWATGSCASRAVSSSDDVGFGGAQASVLERSLRSALGTAASPARSPKRELCFVDTADGRAVMAWRGVRSRSLAAGWLKRRLERRFVAGFAGA